MKNTPKHKFRNAISAAESALIVLLFASLIFMFAQYCILNNANAPSSLPKLSENDGGVFFAPGEDSQNLSESLIMPAFVGYSVNGENFSPNLHDGDYEKFMSLSQPFIKNVFSDISTILEFSSDTAGSEYIDSLTANSNYLYFLFPTELPAAAFVPSFTGEAQEEIFHSFNVRELYIFCDESGNLSGAVTGSDGSIATLTVQNKVNLSFENFSQFTNLSDSNKFEFASIAGEKKPVYSYSVAINDILEYNDTGDFTLDSPEGVSNALTAFGFNPNGTRFYKSTSDGSLTYVQEQGVLSVSTAGDILYSSSGGGMHLSEFLNLERSSYSFSEKICAAHRIINSLDKALYGKDASLCLTDISYSDGSLVLDFCYAVSGVRFEGRAARFIFSDSALTYASVTRNTYKRLSDTSRDIPQKLLVAIYLDRFSDSKRVQGGSFVSVYTSTDTTDEGTLYSSRFALLEKEASVPTDAQSKEEEE